MKYMHDNSQKRLFGSAQKPSSSQGCGDKSICMQVHPSHKEQVQKAEIFWALKVASSGYPYRTCDGTPALFQAMFPGPVSKKLVLCIPTFEGKVPTFSYYFPTFLAKVVPFFSYFLKKGHLTACKRFHSITSVGMEVLG